MEFIFIDESAFCLNNCAKYPALLIIGVQEWWMMLLDKLQPLVPQGTTAANLVQAVEDLPGFQGWSPPEPAALHWATVVKWGLAVWMSREIAGTEELRKQLGAEVLKDGEPRSDTLAELSAAGLCVALGTEAAGRIPRGPTRTADWRMVWPDGVHVDVEVAASDRKLDHVLRSDAAYAIAREISGARRDVDVVIDIVDPTSRADVQALKEVMAGLTVGESRTDPGHWVMRLEGVSRGPGDLYPVKMHTPPDWWSHDVARTLVFAHVAETREATVASGQARVGFGLPYVAYANPIRRKADAPQGTSGLPFLVAVDVEKLPGAMTEIPRVINQQLPIWTAVSGILLFQSIVSTDRAGWLWRLIHNPHALVGLPESLLTKVQETLKESLTYLELGEGK